MNVGVAEASSLSELCGGGGPYASTFPPHCIPTQRLVGVVVVFALAVDIPRSEVAGWQRQPVARVSTTPVVSRSPGHVLMSLSFCPIMAGATARGLFLHSAAAGGGDLARRHQVTDVLLEEFVVVVQLVVLLLDRLDLVEESGERFL